MPSTPAAPPALPASATLADAPTLVAAVEALLEADDVASLVRLAFDDRPPTPPAPRATGDYGAPFTARAGGGVAAGTPRPSAGGPGLLATPRASAGLNPPSSSAPRWVTWTDQPRTPGGPGPSPGGGNTADPPSSSAAPVLAALASVEATRAADADRLCRSGADDLLAAAEALPDMAALAGGLRSSALAARAGLAASGGAWLECLDDAAALASAATAVDGAAAAVRAGRAAAGAAVGAGRAAGEGRLCRALALAGAAREGLAHPALAQLAPVVRAAAASASADAQRQAYAAVNAWLGAARADAAAAGEVALTRAAAARAARRSLAAARRSGGQTPALPPGLAPLFSTALDGATAPVAAALLADAGLVAKAAGSVAPIDTAPLARAARALAASSPTGAADLRSYFFRSRRLQLGAEGAPPPGFPRAGSSRAHAARIAGLFAAGDAAAAAVPVLSGAWAAAVAAAGGEAGGVASSSDDALPWPGRGGSASTSGLIGGATLAAAAAAADAADDGWDDAAAALEAAVVAAAAEAEAGAAAAAGPPPPSPSSSPPPPPPTAADLLAMKDAVLLLADAAAAGGRPAGGLRAALAAAAHAHAAALVPAAVAAARRALGPPSNGARAPAEIADAAEAVAVGGGGEAGGLGLPLAAPPSTAQPRRFPAAAPFSDAAPALARLARSAARDAAAYGAGLGLDPGDALRAARAARDAVASHALAPALLAPLPSLRASVPGALEAALQAAADAGALAEGGASLDAYTVACVVDGGTPLMPPGAGAVPAAGASGEEVGSDQPPPPPPPPAAFTRPPLCRAGSAAAAAPWAAARRSAEATALALVAEAAAAALGRAASLPWLPPSPVGGGVGGGRAGGALGDPPSASASLHVVATQGVLARAAAAASRALPPPRADALTAAAVRAVGDAWMALLSGDAVPAFNAHALGRVAGDVGALVAAVDALQAKHGAGDRGAAWADGLAAPTQLCHALLTPGGLGDLGEPAARAARYGALDVGSLPGLLLKYRDVGGGSGSSSPSSSPPRLGALLKRRPGTGVPGVGARRADVVALARRLQAELEEEEERAAAAAAAAEEEEQGS